MSVFNSAGSGTSTVIISGVTSPLITDIPMALATTEYSIVLPAGTRRFLFKARNRGVLYMRFVSGGDYETIPYGCFRGEAELSITSPLTIYLESSTVNQVVEMTTWT